MATNPSDSMTQDSDTANEMFCEECDEHDNIYVPAESFCVDCVEYKCKDCLRYHRRHNKTHIIQDKCSMPQDFYTEKCSSHPKQIIKHYCSDCEAQACQECKENDHERCGQVKHLPTLVKGIQRSKKLKDLKETLEKVSIDIELTDKLILCKGEMIEKQESEAKEACRKHKHKLFEKYKQHHQKIIEDFDKRMEETIASLTKERKTLVKQLSEKESTFEEKVGTAEKDIERSIEKSNTNYKRSKIEYDNLVKKLKTTSKDLVQAEALDQKCKLFLNMKITEKLCRELGKSIENLKNNEENVIKFKPKLEVNTPVQAYETFKTIFALEKIPKIEKEAKLDSEIDYRFEKFSNLCLFTKSMLVATDFDNCFLIILKISRTKTGKIYKNKLSNGPWSIAKLTDNKIAITFPETGKIIMATVSDSMKVEFTDTIAVNGSCHGIAYFKEQFLVSFFDPGSVKLLDISGTVLTSYDMDSLGNPLFVGPFNVAVSLDKTTIYVSDICTNLVTSMTLDGKVMATYKDVYLKEPCQMTVDEFGSVYVCGRMSHNIHQLTRSLAKVKVLLDDSYAINQPVSVALSNEAHKLYVGMVNSNIKIFNLPAKETTP